MTNSQPAKRRLGELLVIEPQSGIRQRDDGGGETIPYVTTGTVSQGPSVLTNLPTEVTHGDVKGRVLQRDDLLLVTRGVERHESVPCAIVKFDLPAAFAESLTRLRVERARVDPDYLRLYLASRRGSAALAAAATGSVISNLRREALQEVEIYLPDLEAQKRAVEVMTSIEKRLTEFEDTLDTLRDLYDTAREGIAVGVLAPSVDAARGEPL